jgi:Protein of unknown function (DUF4232)
MAMVALLAAGCGGGSDHTTTVTRTVRVPVHSPVGTLSLARRDRDAPRIEPGHRPRSEAGCVEPRGGHVKTVYLRSEGETCLRVAPRDRLLFAEAVGPGEEAGGVEVRAGPYQGYGRIGGSVLIPAAVGTYLSPGLHRVHTGADVTAPLVLVLPEGCQVADTKPGESLCFAGHRPPCKASDLRVHALRGGAGLGTYYAHDLIVNRSARTCTVSGFPHVVPLDSRGRPVLPSIPTSGYTTTNDGNHPRRIALEPGAAATFEINTSTAADYSPRSSCRPRRAATLRIHVPGSGDGTESVTYGMELCTERSNVSVGRIE